MASKKAEAKQIISDLLLKEHSKANTEIIYEYIGRDPLRIAALVDIICTDTKKLHQRGSYVMWRMRFKKADLLLPHLDRLLTLLPNPAHESFARALTCILFSIEIPEKHLGTVADYCFSALEDPNSAIAIRANSITILINVCKREPELCNDLELLIAEHYEHGTAAFKSRAKRAYAEIEKIRKNTQA